MSSTTRQENLVSRNLPFQRDSCAWIASGPIILILMRASVGLTWSIHLPVPARILSQSINHVIFHHEKYSSNSKQIREFIVKKFHNTPQDLSLPSPLSLLNYNTYFWPLCKSITYFLNILYLSPSSHSTTIAGWQQAFGSRRMATILTSAIWIRSKYLELADLNRA